MNRNVVVAGLAIVLGTGLLGTILQTHYGAGASVGIRLVADVIGLVMVWRGLG